MLKKGSELRHWRSKERKRHPEKESAWLDLSGAIDKRLSLKYIAFEALDGGIAFTRVRATKISRLLFFFCVSSSN